MNRRQPIFGLWQRAVAWNLLAVMSLWLSGLAPAWHLATAHAKHQSQHAATDHRAPSDDRHHSHDDGQDDHDHCRICDLAHASWIGTDLSLDVGYWRDLPIGRLTIDAQRPACLAYISFPLARDPPSPPPSSLSPLSPAPISAMCNWG